MQRTTRHTILLVEANPSLRRMIALGLHHHGLHIIEVDSPASFPASSPVVPDLMVFDIDGEAGNGQAGLSQAEAHPVLSALPLVVLAWENHFQTDMRDEDAQHSAPPRAYLTKPFDARALHLAIEQLLLDSQETRREEAAAKQKNHP